jgi:hypothetical protein
LLEGTVSLTEDGCAVLEHEARTTGLVLPNARGHLGDYPGGAAIFSTFPELETVMAEDGAEAAYGGGHPGPIERARGRLATPVPSLTRRRPLPGLRRRPLAVNALLCRGSGPVPASSSAPSRIEKPRDRPRPQGIGAPVRGHGWR